MIQNRILVCKDVNPTNLGVYETDVYTYKFKCSVYFPEKTEDELIQMAKDASKPEYIEKMLLNGFTQEEAETKFEEIFAIEIAEDPNKVEEPVASTPEV